MYFDVLAKENVKNMKYKRLFSDLHGLAKYYIRIQCWYFISKCLYSMPLIRYALITWSLIALSLFVIVIARVTLYMDFEHVPLKAYGIQRKYEKLLKYLTVFH